MSDSSERIRRKPPARRHAGSTVSALIGLVLFLTPFFVFGRGLWVATGPLAVAGAELVTAILATIVLNAIFVASETAIELLRSSHIKQTATDSRRGRILQEVIAHKPLYVAACFLGAQTMRAWLILLTIPFAMELSPNVSETLHLVEGWPSVTAAGFAIAIPVVAVNVIFGELIPRTYAVADPVSAVCRTFGFVKTFFVIFKPVATGFTIVGGLLTQRFGAKASFSVANQAEEEIKERLEQAVETQEIEEEEKAMLHSVFEFGDTVAREIMTPRVDLDSVSVETTISEMPKVVEETGHSRFPVFEGSDDNIVGVVHAKDVLSAISRGEADKPLQTLMRPPVFVPENKNLHDLLHEMRAVRTQMVIVQDEFGGTAGVVTVEDIVEEVVGEIVDEYDDEELELVKNGNAFSIGGKMNIHDVNSEIGTSFESDEFDTFGGYVFGLFGRQPEIGDVIESEGYKFTVEDTDGRRISLVGLEKLEEGEGIGSMLSHGSPSHDHS